MDHTFTTEEWRRLSWSERVRHCRSMAESARLLADHALPDMREHYTNLCQGWLDLAQEIEASTTATSTTQSGQTKRPPFPIRD
jgi:hypothetical protein